MKIVMPILLCCFLLIPVCSLADTMGPIEYNTDRNGSDYTNFELPQPDPQLCLDACLNDPNCKAWTLVRPGITGAKSRCWLKNAVPEPVSNPDCTSGTKLMTSQDGGIGQPPETGQGEKDPGAKRKAKEKLKDETGQQSVAQYSPSDSTYRFNPQNLIIDEFKGGWAVKDSTNLTRAIHYCPQEKRGDCEKVLTLLQFYGINEQIYTAGNGMTFYLASGNAPSGSYPGESCRAFNPQTLTIQQGTVISSKVTGTPDWEILENGKLFFRIMGNTGPSDEATARRIVDLIQQTGINNRCSLGGFTYMRK